MSRLRSHDETVRGAHGAFYQALDRGDMETVHAVWSRDVPVSCQHAEWPPISGRRFVLESWADRLRHCSTACIRTDDLTVVVTGRRAMVIAVERWGQNRAATTTLYRHEGHNWHITHHQAMAIRSYLDR